VHEHPACMSGLYNSILTSHCNPCGLFCYMLTSIQRMMSSMQVCCAVTIDCDSLCVPAHLRGSVVATGHSFVCATLQDARWLMIFEFDADEQSTCNIHVKQHSTASANPWLVYSLCHWCLLLLLPRACIGAAAAAASGSAVAYDATLADNEPLT
jgi:hypothetical protein